MQGSKVAFFRYLSMSHHKSRAEAQVYEAGRVTWVTNNSEQQKELRVKKELYKTER